MAASEPEAHDYLLYDVAVGAAGRLSDARLTSLSERHKLELAPPAALSIVEDIVGEARRNRELKGVIMQLSDGLPRRSLIRWSRSLRRAGKDVYFYWPAEGAIEVVDDLRLKHLWRQWVLFQAHNLLRRRPQATGTPAAERDQAIATLRQGVATIHKGAADWSGEMDGIRRETQALRTLTDAIQSALAASGYQSLAERIDAYKSGLETVVAHLAKSQLATNRIGYCLQDLAKEAERPAIAGAIDPAHLRGIRGAVQGANEQLSSIRGEAERNIAGFRETASMVRHALETRPVNGAAAATDAVIRDNVGVVVRLAQAFNGYFDAAVTTAAEQLPVVRGAGEHVSEKADALEAAGRPSAGVPAAAPESANAGALVARLRTLAATARGRAAPVPLRLGDRLPTAERPLAGTGIYLRTDFWAPLVSGGSYGHTCYQARALARTSERFVALTANRFPLLDDIGVRQVVVRPEGLDGSELSVVRANEHYHAALRTAFEVAQPAYVFERICLGNFAAARICRDLGIPYVVEYNGSEISMKRSFDSKPYEYEDLYLEAEAAAFEQATLISVVSDAVRDDVVKRGIDPARVLVNWNAVDLDAYKAPAEGEREKLRRELGFTPADQVVCFIGTFGGWHGIDVLAAALPRVLAEAPEARFLLIGDGRLKGQVDEVIAAHNLSGRVVQTGRVEQARGAQLMGAADIFVSPHATDMVDSRFFGSPTKLFEYMGYGRAIVATDLEQIGEVMRPSLRPGDLGRSAGSVTRERGVLCKPGSVDEFVASVVGLVRDPALGAALGSNALEAARASFTWDAHVAKLWRFAAAQGKAAGLEPARTRVTL
jgi:glycosyltransferase involved in cell wall biosynthesis